MVVHHRVEEPSVELRAWLLRTRGTQREKAAQGNHGATASTTAGDQHSLPLSLEDLSKIAELIVRQLPTNLATDNNTTQTTAAVLVPPTSSPAVTVVQSSTHCNRNHYSNSNGDPRTSGCNRSTSDASSCN